MSPTSIKSEMLGMYLGCRPLPAGSDWRTVRGRDWRPRGRPTTSPNCSWATGWSPTLSVRPGRSLIVFNTHECYLALGLAIDCPKNAKRSPASFPVSVMVTTTISSGLHCPGRDQPDLRQRVGTPVSRPIVTLRARATPSPAEHCWQSRRACPLRLACSPCRHPHRTLLAYCSSSDSSTCRSCSPTAATP